FNYCCGSAGGGGGYSGGAGGNECAPAGGGGSYNAGSNQSNTSGVNSGNGVVIISYNSNTGPTISQSGGHASGYAFPVGTTTNTFLATDPSGNTSTCSFTVTVVDAQPPVIPSCPSNITQCNHTLSYSSPSATDNCSATVSCSPPSGTTVSAGITTVVCTATDAAGNTATCSFTVTVVDLTIGITETDNSGTTSNDGIICNGFSASLDAGVHSSYSWSNGSTAESFTVSPTATTTYTVTISNGAGCTGSVSQVITVKSNLSASASVTTLIPCIGTNGVITVSASGGTSPYTGIGTYSEPNGTYSFTVSDVNGCTATTSQIITQPSQVNFTATVTNNSSCTTAHVASISVSASGGTGTKVYSDNGGTSYQGASLFSALANGSYTVVVKDSNGCVSSPSVKVITSITGITIGSTPMVNATTCTAANGRITVIASGGAGVYNYSKNGGVAWQSSNIFNLLTAGTYYIKVKDPLGCASAIDAVAVASNTGSCSTRLAENSNTSGSGDFTVYPNPASSEVTIGFSSDKETRYSVTVADMTGRIIINENHTSVVGDNQFQMNISSLSKGIYMVILQNSDGTLQKKIMVQ
ncbi:MAG TPA: HYR domain-containing protein, partial [Bacteroidia bacterium]|nr:HYR domain-containing protein [Bacteroidia bacterium]